MTDDKDYSNEPVSLGFLRSEKTQDAKDWSPRDVLIEILRDIDKGELNPDALVVIHTQEGENQPGFSLSSPSHMHTISMITNFAFDLHLRHRDL